MERELSAMLSGRRVDMRTPGDLSRYFRDDVIAHAVVQYAEDLPPLVEELDRVLTSARQQ
jgi:hypothetical protein